MCVYIFICGCGCAQVCLLCVSPGGHAGGGVLAGMGVRCFYVGDLCHAFLGVNWIDPLPTSINHPSHFPSFTHTGAPRAPTRGGQPGEGGGAGQGVGQGRGRVAAAGGGAGGFEGAARVCVGWDGWMDGWGFVSDPSIEQNENRCLHTHTPTPPRPHTKPLLFPLSFLHQGYDRPAREALAKRMRIANTQRLYKQQRFNLLSEESEGYCKVKIFD